MKLWHRSVMMKGKRGLLEVCLLMNSLFFFPLFSLSHIPSSSVPLPLPVCSILHAGIVLNTSWHCWRHLGQSCFDFIIHVSCSRLGPHVKDTSGFLLNSLLRIELWLACLLANTVHSIYCGAATACTSMPASVCVFLYVCVCVILPLCASVAVERSVRASYVRACFYVCGWDATGCSSVTVRAWVGVLTRGTLGSA